MPIITNEGWGGLFGYTGREVSGFLLGLVQVKMVAVRVHLSPKDHLQGLGLVLGLEG
jgi:hypothetical protein